MRRIVAVLVGLVLGLAMFASPSAAAEPTPPMLTEASLAGVPSLTACPNGYICFWEHANYAGAKSMYYRPSGCVRLPHGTGFVGNKVSSMWNRSGVSAKVYDNDGCGFPNFVIQFNHGNGYSNLAGQFNDRISSTRRDGT